MIMTPARVVSIALKHAYSGNGPRDIGAQALPADAAEERDSHIHGEDAGRTKAMISPPAVCAAEISSAATGFYGAVQHGLDCSYGYLAVPEL
jgi:hypothetical protein